MRRRRRAARRLLCVVTILTTGAILAAAEPRLANADGVRALRPDRAYQLILVPSQGPARLLVTRRFGQIENVLRSEHELQVSADRRWLGYRGSHNDLHIRSATGTERVIDGVNESGGFAFAPDGRSLAVSGCGPWPSDEVILVELETGARRSLGHLERVDSMRWTAGGLVIFHRLARYHSYSDFELSEWDWWSVSALFRLPLSFPDGVDSYHPPGTAGQIWDDALSLFPPDGGPDLLFRGPLYTFAASARASRVIAFARNGPIVELDAAAPDAPPRTIEQNRGVVDNAELSPDGTRALFVGTRTPDWEPQTYLIESKGAPRAIAGGCDELSFTARVGAAFVCRIEEAGLLYGPVNRPPVRVAPGGAGAAAKIQSVRFLADGRFIVAAGDQVFIWDAERDTREPLWREVDPARRIIAADRFDGGLIVWIDAPPGRAPIP